MFPRTTLFAIIMALAVTAQAETPAFDMEIRGEGRPVYMIPGLATPASAAARQQRRSRIWARVGMIGGGFSGLAGLIAGLVNAGRIAF